MEPLKLHSHSPCDFGGAKINSAWAYSLKPSIAHRDSAYLVCISVTVASQYSTN